MTNAEKLRLWRERNPGKASEYVQSYRQRNPEKVKAFEAAYRARNREKRALWGKAEWTRHREERRDKTRMMRAEMIREYGGKCSCCGESNPKFLTIDHVDGTGSSHRKEIYGGHGSGGTTIVKWLKSEGWPKENFQLLCYNCNCAKGFLGACPHEANRLMYEFTGVGGA